MTTGEQLVSLSGATSGTALAHLLAITTGSGSVETVFAGTVRVVTSTPEVFAQRITRRKPVEQTREAPQGTSQRKAGRSNLIYVTSPVSVSHPFTCAEEVFVSMRQAPTIVVQTAGNSVVARRKKT